MSSKKITRKDTYDYFKEYIDSERAKTIIKADTTIGEEGFDLWSFKN